MAVVSYPFDAGAGSSIIESQWRRMGRLWLPDTVAQQAATGAGLNNLAVAQRGAGANMSVDVASGQAWLNGHFYQSDAVQNLSIAANASGNPRIDRIVLRLDTTANTIVAAVLQGTPAGSPTAPALTQSIDGTWEISLAQIAVANGAASIVTANITDERVRANGVPLTLPGATAATRHIGATASGAPTTPSALLAIGDRAVAQDGVMWIYTAGGWVTSAAAGGASSTADTAAVATSEATTSTSYTDLTTPGPAVTVTTRTKALVILTAYMVTANASTLARMGVAVSGATTTAAADASSLTIGYTGTAPNLLRASVVMLLTLTAGSNVFTAKFKSSDGSSVTFADRSIIVIPTN